MRWWGGKGRARLERVGRDVDPAAVADLLEHPPRATVAFVHGDEVEALPALARWRGGVHGFAVRAEDAPDLDGREVVLVRDDGPYWFELRGVTVRGLARRVITAYAATADATTADATTADATTADATTADATTADATTSDVVTWYMVEPRRVLAWDYGALRVVPGD